MNESSATQLVGKYLASKGLPVTGENVRRALEMNASNPGVIPGLVNQAPPPPDNVGPQTTQSNGGARRQPALQTQGGTHEVGSGVKPTAPRAASDSAASAPQPQNQTQSSDGNGLLQSIAALIMGGAGGAGLGALLGRGGSAQPAAPVASVGQPAQLPAPAQIEAPREPLPVSGPAPMPQISDRNMVGEGVNPVGPPQPGRIAPGPSSQVPAQMNPEMKTMGAPSAGWPAGTENFTAPKTELSQGINWSKVLGEVAGGAGKVLRR